MVGSGRCSCFAGGDSGRSGGCLVDSGGSGDSVDSLLAGHASIIESLLPIFSRTLSDTGLLIRNISTA